MDSRHRADKPVVLYQPAVMQRGLDIGGEERVRFEWLGLQFRVEIERAIGMVALLLKESQ